jgi:hypothetical protein
MVTYLIHLVTCEYVTILGKLPSHLSKTNATLFLEEDFLKKTTYYKRLPTTSITKKM